MGPCYDPVTTNSCFPIAQRSPLLSLIPSSSYSYDSSIILDIERIRNPYDQIDIDLKNGPADKN